MLSQDSSETAATTSRNFWFVVWLALKLSSYFCQLERNDFADQSSVPLNSYDRADTIAKAKLVIGESAMLAQNRFSLPVLFGCSGSGKSFGLDLVGSQAILQEIFPDHHLHTIAVTFNGKMNINDYPGEESGIDEEFCIRLLFRCEITFH